jgi:hypothetical protein
VELLNLIGPPLVRRQQRWMQSVAEALVKHEALLVRDLESDEAFLSAIAQAHSAATRTHNEEKHRALRNAVVNTALGLGRSPDLTPTFIRFVDELTAEHLALLSAMANQEDELRGVASYQAMLDHLAPGATQEEFRLLCQDLAARLLVRISDQVEDFPDVAAANLKRVYRRRDVPPRFRVTALGRSFLAFITEREP